jgi:exodeoxyribonuclease VII small subunit
MSEKKVNDKQTFEESLARLEQIVSQMDAGELGLDEMIAKFEEGSRLIKTCSDKLNEVERKIEKLVKKDGELSTEEFDEDSAV